MLTIRDFENYFCIQGGEKRAARALTPPPPGSAAHLPRAYKSWRKYLRIPFKTTFGEEMMAQWEREGEREGKMERPNLFERIALEHTHNNKYM